MTRRLTPASALLVFGMIAQPSTAQDPVLTGAAGDPVAITSATVVDVTDGTLHPNQTVLVEGSHIAVVGDADEVEVPARASAIDGRGKSLIPGLWDMHVHTGNDRNTREIMYPLLVAHGITGIRNMMADCFGCGPTDFSIEQVNARRRAVARGELLGPRVVASSTFAGSHEQAARRPTEGPSPQAPAAAADARAFVRLAKERGVDVIKVYDMLPQEAYFALVDEAKRLGLPFAGHAPIEVRESEVSDAGQASIEHPGLSSFLVECSSNEDDLRARMIAEFYKAGMGSRNEDGAPAVLPLMLQMIDTYDAQKCAALAERFVRNRTWVVATLMAMHPPSELGRGWREDPYARFLSPEERRYFEQEEEIHVRDQGNMEQRAPHSRWVREVTRTMHRAGVPMLAASDPGAAGIFWGIGLHQESELLGAAGLTEADALRAATLGPAEVLEATDSLGTVEIGKLADLVDADPLEEISNTQRIAAVVHRGRYLDGPGIVVSRGCVRNRILDKTFDDLAGPADVLEGDSNHVELRSASDSVHDIGSGNHVTTPRSDALRGPAGRAGAERAARLSGGRAEPDTIRYTVIIDGHSKGERRMWQEDPVTWRLEYVGDPYDSYQFPRTERLVLDAEGLPVQVEIRGEIGRGTWEERFELQESRARWSTLTRWQLRPFDPPDLFGGDPFEEVGKESADTLVVGPAFYAAVYPVHDVGVAARALLRRPDRSLPLLPAGEARLEVVGDRGVEVDGRSRRIRHYAVHGLDLRPAYVWLDEGGATFADEWSIRAGWEAVFPELRVATEQALADHHARLAESLVPPVRERPLVIRGARLFDPASETTRPEVTIVVEGDRVAAVGADGSMDLPPGAEIIDATGRTALPGLWDMHAHHGIPSLYLELDAPLHLAGGITTARDLGSHTGPILSLRSRIGSGEAVGPRLLLSGFIDGPGRRPSGVLVGNAAEARAAVDRFAELGYVQIKIYGQVPPALVPEIIERARTHGMRVSGHIPAGMHLRDAVEAGFDEIQHADQVFMNLDGVPELFADLEASYEAIERLTADPVQVRELVDLLVTHDVALEPTLTILDSWSRMPLPWFVRMLERLPPQARRRVAAAQGFKLWPVHPLWDQIFDNVLDIVRQMHEAGVPVLPGSDMMPGIAVHRELELYVQAGIPAPEALTLATLDAGGLALQIHTDTLLAAHTTTAPTATMTPHFAWGPGAERFSGIRDNDEIGRMLLGIARRRESELRQNERRRTGDDGTSAEGKQP